MRHLIGDSRRNLLPGVVILIVTLLCGCATQSRSLLQSPPAGLPPRAELSAAPFFPQERYQCGPATLAMSLNVAGVATTPEELVPEVYVPQREGSLQPEMLAASRRHGTLAFVIPPKLDAVLTEVAAGNPVVVLQNLSLPWFPLWHYALVIGYDLPAGEVVLRSGVTERLVMQMSTFEHTWARGQHWAMVTQPVGKWPATVEEETAVNALVAFEKSNPPSRARQAYEAGLRRWPHNLTMQMGSGNVAYAAGDRAAAATFFRRATADHPDSAPAFNNLASVLLELGEISQAREAAEKAVTLGGPWRDTAMMTLEAIKNKKAGKR